MTEYERLMKKAEKYREKAMIAEIISIVFQFIALISLLFLLI
jgi:hypothetical protein